MRNSRLVTASLCTWLAGFAVGRLIAQPGIEKARWETLMRASLPEDCEPKISVFSLPVAPAPPVPRAVGTGHTHAGPVFAYIVKGEIENQVEPDPPLIYKPGQFFYETPGHVHRFLRNLSGSEPASLIIFEAGYTAKAAPSIKLLLEEPFPSTANQEVRLLRLTLPPGALATDRTHSGPGVVYVLDGKVEVSGAEDQAKIYGAGDLFDEVVYGIGLSFRNASAIEPAKLLLYQVVERRVAYAHATGPRRNNI
jgi:quercetin dioxygenase-like cupin family protein